MPDVKLTIDNQAKEAVQELDVYVYPRVLGADSDGPHQPDEAARIDAVLESLMVDRTEENRAQMSVYLRAFEIFLDRNKRHRAGWRVAGVSGILVDIRKKVERLWNEFMLSEKPPMDVDSALDAINYLGFFVQAADEEKAGRTVGTWVWPNSKHGRK